MYKSIVALAGAGLLAAACTQTGNIERNAAAGALIGGAAGAVIGNNVGDGNAGRGAAIGAAVGAAAGAVRGSEQDRANQQRYWDSRAGRYYYCYDNRQNECYWEDGRRRY